MKRFFALAALLVFSALLLSGCGFSALGYEHPDMYTAGGGEIPGAVENLDVSWLDGQVMIAYAPRQGTVLSETADRELSPAEQLHWWLDGKTLRVQYAEAGLRWMNAEKRLTVTLPEGTVLKNVRIACTSGRIEAAPFYGETVHFSTTSGNIHAECAASSLRLTATSGNVTLRGAANSIEIQVTSGSINAAVEHADSLNASVTSGSLQMDLDDVRQARASATSGRISLLTDRVGELRADITSGPIVARCKRAPEEARLSATSGSISLSLPKEAGFTAQISTLSGKTAVLLPAKQDGTRYLSGDGAAQIYLSTLSGGINLDAYQE